MAKITDIGIRNLKPGRSRREIPDGSGLYIMVQPSGRKGFCVRYRHLGRTRKLTLPPGLTLAAARRLAADAAYQVAQGIDPAAKKKAAKHEAAMAKANTIAAICAEYMRREGPKLRTVDQRENILRRLVFPAIGDRQIDSIKRSELVRLLDRIEDKSGPRMAHVTLSVLQRIFNWYALCTDDFASPIVRGMGRINVKERGRARILDDAELRRVWPASTAEEMQLFGALIRFLLLTAARRTEAAGMRWDEVDTDGVWTLPARRSKTKSEVVRPMSKAAQAILEAQPRYEGCPFVFTGNGITATMNFGEPKEKLDAASGVTGWRLHDLRRTARSLLSRAGITPDVAERCLGHVIPGVRGVYDRHRYIDEMRHAFEALATQVERIIDPREGTVVPIKAERRPSMGS